MAEDLRSKMAAIAAAKEGRAKQAIEAKTNTEIGEAQEAAGQENALRDKAMALEARVGVAEQSAKEAEEAIRQAQGMLAEGGLEPEEQAIIESGITEEQQKIEELNVTRTELVDVKAEIEQLNTKPEVAVEPKTENVVEASPEIKKSKAEIIMEQIRGTMPRLDQLTDERLINNLNNKMSTDRSYGKKVINYGLESGIIKKGQDGRIIEPSADDKLKLAKQFAEEIRSKDDGLYIGRSFLNKSNEHTGNARLELMAVNEGDDVEKDKVMGEVLENNIDAFINFYMNNIGDRSISREIQDDKTVDSLKMKLGRIKEIQAPDIRQRILQKLEKALSSKPLEWLVRQNGEYKQILQKIKAAE